MTISESLAYAHALIAEADRLDELYRWSPSPTKPAKLRRNRARRKAAVAAIACIRFLLDTPAVEAAP